ASRSRGGGNNRLDLGTPHVVVARLDVQLHRMAKSNSSTDVDAEVVGGTVADNRIDRDGGRIADQPVWITDRCVANAWRCQLDDSMVDADASQNIPSKRTVLALSAI